MDLNITNIIPCIYMKNLIFDSILQTYFCPYNYYNVFYIIFPFVIKNKNNSINIWNNQIVMISKSS